jgi:hypothetical protein
VKPLSDLVVGLDWSGIANDVVAGLVLAGVIAVIGICVATVRDGKWPARMFVKRAAARLPQSVRESRAEEWNAEVDHGEAKTAIRFAFGIWFRAGDVSAAVGAGLDTDHLVSSPAEESVAFAQPTDDDLGIPRIIRTAHPMPCPPLDILLAYVDENDESLTPRRRQRIREHLQFCESCQMQVECVLDEVLHGLHEIYKDAYDVEQAASRRRESRFRDELHAQIKLLTPPPGRRRRRRA